VLDRLGWNFPTMLAPMEGVTHPTFRELAVAQGGIGIVCTEFVRVSRAELVPERLRDEVVKASGTPLSVQVMGNDADKMAEAARLIEEAGADVVDINMGCPMPRVVRKGVGAAMLKDPALLDTVVSKMRSQVRGTLSAKIRAGFDNADEVVQIAEVVQRAGVDFLVVHPRRRCDFYEGVADWRIIKVLKESLHIPVIGNGDVWYAADVQRMRDETGCDAVMIGRPALRNPWIFRQAAELAAGQEPFAPNGDDVVRWFEGLAEDYRTSPRVKYVAGKLKEALRYLGRTLPDRGHFLRCSLRLQTSEELVEAFRAEFSGRSAETLDLGAYGELGLEASGSARGIDPRHHDAHASVA